MREPPFWSSFHRRLPSPSYAPSEPTVDPHPSPLPEGEGTYTGATWLSPLPLGEGRGEGLYPCRSTSYRVTLSLQGARCGALVQHRRVRPLLAVARPRVAASALFLLSAAASATWSDAEMTVALRWRRCEPARTAPHGMDKHQRCGIAPGIPRLRRHSNPLQRDVQICYRKSTL